MRFKFSARIYLPGLSLCKTKRQRAEVEQKAKSHLLYAQR